MDVFGRAAELGAVFGFGIGAGVAMLPSGTIFVFGVRLVGRHVFAVRVEEESVLRLVEILKRAIKSSSCKKELTWTQMSCVSSRA